MPVEIRRLDLGEPPTRTVTRGALKGQEVPRYEVILPGWNDIIRVAPTAGLTPEERSVEKQRLNASLNRSPTPEVLKHLSEIGQAVDDVQDGLVTLSVAGRLAQKLIGRAIPGVGTIATLADVLNALNIFYPKAAREAITGAIERGAGKLSGRKRYLASKELKRAFGLGAKENVGTYLRRLEESLKTGKVNVGVGELLQIGQTSEALTGYGIALGPIFGALQDTTFGILRGARFDFSGPLGLTAASRDADQFEHMRQFSPGEWQMYLARAQSLARAQNLPTPTTAAQVAKIIAKNPVRVQVDFPGIIPAIDIVRGVPPGSTEKQVAAALAPVVDVINKGAVTTLAGIGVVKKATVEAASKVWNAGKWLVGVRGDLPWEVHLEIMLAQQLALQEYEPFLSSFDWGIVGQAAAQREEGSLPFCPLEHRHSRRLGDVVLCLARGAAGKRFDWIDEIPDSIGRDFARSAVSGFAECFISSVEGSDARVVEESSAEYRVLTVLHDFDLLPPAERSDEETAAFLAHAIALTRAAAPAFPSLSAMRSAFVSSFPGVVLE